MKRLIIAALLACGLNLGCAFSDPTTKLGGGAFGWSFSDNKDNDISFDEATYDPETRQFTIKNLKVRNNSSDPRIANVEQMKAHTQQILAFSELFARLAAALPTPPGWQQQPTIVQVPPATNDPIARPEVKPEAKE